MKEGTNFLIYDSNFDGDSECGFWTNLQGNKSLDIRNAYKFSEAEADYIRLHSAVPLCKVKWF